MRATQPSSSDHGGGPQACRPHADLRPQSSLTSGSGGLVWISATELDESVATLLLPCGPPPNSRTSHTALATSEARSCSDPYKQERAALPLLRRAGILPPPALPLCSDPPPLSALLLTSDGGSHCASLLPAPPLRPRARCLGCVRMHRPHATEARSGRPLPSLDLACGRTSSNLSAVDP